MQGGTKIDFRSWWSHLGLGLITLSEDYEEGVGGKRKEKKRKGFILGLGGTVAATKAHDPKLFRAATLHIKIHLIRQPLYTFVTRHPEKIGNRREARTEREPEREQTGNRQKKIQSKRGMDKLERGQETKGKVMRVAMKIRKHRG